MNTVAVIEFCDDSQGLETEVMMSLNLYLHAKAERYNFDAHKTAKNKIIVDDLIKKQTEILDGLKSDDEDQIAQSLDAMCKFSDRHAIVDNFLTEHIGDPSKIALWQLYDAANKSTIKKAVVDSFGEQQALRRYIRIACLCTGDFLEDAIKKATDYIKSSKVPNLMAIPIGAYADIDSIDLPVVHNDPQLEAVFARRRETQEKLYEAASARDLVKNIAKSITDVNRLSEVQSQLKFQITENDVIASALE